MKMWLLVAMMGMGTSAMAGEKPVKHIVTLGDHGYTVRHKVVENTAQVTWRGIRLPSAALWSDMKRASETATGCTAADTFLHNNTTLFVTLDCSKRLVS